MLENSLTLNPNPDYQVCENGIWKYSLMRAGGNQRQILIDPREQPIISLSDLGQPYRAMFYALLIGSAALAANLYFEVSREKIFDALTKSTTEEKTVKQPSKGVNL